VAPRINSLPKYAFSRSLGSAPWGNYEEAAIKSGDAGQVIRRLKSEIAGDLILWGSLSLTYYLFEAGVIDKVRLVVAPSRSVRVAASSRRGRARRGSG
jgi:hypothetical protein